MTVTADNLVHREVRYCVSALVSTLAAGAYVIDAPLSPQQRGRNAQALRDLAALAEQAAELCAPILDYEEAAYEAGFEQRDLDGVPHWCHRDTPADNPCENFYETAEDVCDNAPADPIEREVFEHWIVSDWLAEKLAAKGEKVDTDFAGLTVWARTMTGQGIASDSVIQDIVADLNKPESDA